MKPLYFDYNATTPVPERVREAMNPYLEEHFGNPSSDHPWGVVARQAVERARGRIAKLIKASPQEIIFTSCATESTTLALWGGMGGCQGVAGRLVISAVEHPATVQCAAAIAKAGARVATVPVDGQGLVSLQEVKKAAAPGTKMISLMMANNETGVIQPVGAIAAWARERGILVHCDAAQAVGKLPVDVNTLGVDLLTIAGHKFYAPKGVGALYLRQGVNLVPLLAGGGQEAGIRAGTENVPYAVALGEAAALASEDLPREAARQKRLGQRLLAGLEELGVEFRLHGEGAPRLPQTMMIGFKDSTAGDMVSGLSKRMVGVSAGAACHGQETSISPVLLAMSVAPEWGRGAVRFSWGRPTSLEDVDEMLARLAQVIRETGR